MCVKLLLLLILQGEMYWMCLENLKVLHELSISGYYKIENWLNLTFSKLIFQNYLEKQS